MTARPPACRARSSAASIPGLDDPNVLDAAQRLTERRRAAAEAVIAAAAVEERA